MNNEQFSPIDYSVTLIFCVPVNEVFMLHTSVPISNIIYYVSITYINYMNDRVYLRVLEHGQINTDNRQINQNLKTFFNGVGKY